MENKMITSTRIISMRLLSLWVILDLVIIQAVNNMITPIEAIEYPSVNEGCVVKKLRKTPVSVSSMPVIFNGESRYLVMGIRIIPI
jgi:hypothetical protein